jgi:hypothetical protein
MMMTPITSRTNTTHRGTPITFGRCVFAALAGAAAIATVMFSGGSAPAVGGDELEFDDARMIIEYNSTDEDIGIQIFVDGEEWKRLRVYDPHNKRILDIRGMRSLELQGLTELFFESSEPSLADLSLEEFLARFPEGEYDFEGMTIDGEAIEGEATFTHAIPNGAVLVSPVENSVQSAANTVVDWNPVADPPGSTIVAYQVIVTQILDVLPERTFSVHVPAMVTSVHVPAEFMQAGAEYEFEVLAIEAGGNQTITASFFSTAP